MLADYLQSGKLLYLFMEKEKKSNQRSNLKEETLENSGSKDHFTNPFSREVWETTYKGPGEVSVEDTWARVAQAVASPESGEESQNLWKDRFYNLLYGFKFIPGGRILANAGIAGTKTSLVNCFVSAFPKDIDIDSLDGIMWILTNQAKTLKAEGGWGMNCSWLRPRGAYIKGINSRSPGAVKYLELFDKSSEIITEGPGVYDIVDNTPRPNEKKKIRKGAMMLCMSCWHGDLLEFIQAKQKPNHLTKMNISVCLTDKFMDKLVKIRKLEAKEQTPEVQAEIKELDKWDLVFPDTEHPKYSEWDGNLDLWESKGYPIKVYRHASVREIWDMLMRSTYNRNDPGVIFIDRVNRTHCAGYIEDTYISSSNPCLAEGSLVDTPDGERLIETIKEGDVITTMHSNGYEPVTSIEVHHDYPVNKVVFADGTVHRATDGHIYWTWNPEKQEIDRETRLKDLMPGASVAKRQGDGTLAYVPIVSIEPDGKATVYDLYCKESDSWCVNGFVQRGCGEQFLISSRTHGGGSCNLGSLNLTQYVKVNKDGKAVFDFKAFAEDIPAAVRFLDNVIQIANMPLEQYTDNALKFRRIGMGVMGVGSMLAMLGIPFNDSKAYELLTRILTVYNVEGVKASLRLGREKGAYYACNAEKHYEILHKALKLDDSAWKEIDKVYDETGGTFRNSALFSIQPTGNTGVLANMASGGLEPIFNLEYVRTAGVATVPDYIKGKCPRYWEQDFAPNEYFKQVSIPEWGIEYLEYKCPEDGETYKIFKDRGLCKDVYCCDYSVQWLKANGRPFKPESILTAMQLTPKDHLDSLQVFAEHLDSSASKSINTPNSITYEDFKDIYLNAYKGGYIKGVTTYRDGTMAGVLNNVKKDEESKADATCIPKTQAPKRPKTLECRLHLLKIKDVPYYAIVSLFGGDPYEVFIGVNEENIYDSDGEYAGKRVIFPPKLNGATGSFTKKAQGKYEFKSGDFTHMIVRKNEPDDMANTIAAFSRILSCGLRHGTDLAFMVEQLEKTEGSFTTPARVLARALKKYIPDGKKVSGEKCPNCGNELVRKEGCKSCANCGWSACG